MEKADLSLTDAIIFDMDGTLWDATPSYRRVWVECFGKKGIGFPLTEDDVKSYMGLTLDEILDRMTERMGVAVDREPFLEDLRKVEDELLPNLGGKLFDGVLDGIKELAGRYRLFMVSNCGKMGLLNFMSYTGTASYFTDSLTNGQTGLPKEGNIARLIDCHGLRHAVYVGDTQADCDATHRAGIPFVFAAYGFGHCEDYDIKFDNFTQLAQYFMNIQKMEE